jgi:hypothetical protein
MGGFETWTTWVRDPLLTLGCPDIVERVLEAQQQDTARSADVAFFEIWHDAHGTRAVELREVSGNVAMHFGHDGKAATKHQLSKRLRNKAGTRAGGWLFERISEGVGGASHRAVFRYRVVREDGLYPDKAHGFDVVPRDEPETATAPKVIEFPVRPGRVATVAAVAGAPRAAEEEDPLAAMQAAQLG